jgi:hypothetical protein
MLRKILAAGACCIVVVGCEKIDPISATDAGVSVDAPSVEVVQRPTIQPLEACKYGAEIKARDIAFSTNLVVRIEKPDEYTFDFTTSDSVIPVTCNFDDNGITKLTVDGSAANSTITRSVLAETDKFLPITELPHIAGSTLTAEGGFISFYTIFQVTTPPAPACLLVTYKADTVNEDSIFLSFNGTPFENSYIPITGDEKGVASFELPSGSKTVTVRAKNRELPDVYGFEVATCG